jgi:hypothetical protein
VPGERTASVRRPRGLLPEDLSEIRLVPAADREWWSRLSNPAKLRVAEKRGKKWTDEETERLIRADPERDDYYHLAEAMARTPGALRTRRAHMIHLLREEYGYSEKARLYFQDQRRYHKFADIGQVHRVLAAVGILALPVSHQFLLARHLKQPSSSWRGDHTTAVLRERRERATALKRVVRPAKRKRVGRATVAITPASSSAGGSGNSAGSWVA